MIQLFRLVSVFAFLLLPSVALGAMSEIRLAYIDPGTGSFLIQALIAALAGIGITGRLYWTKIKSMLGMGSKSNDDEDFDGEDE